MTANYRAAREFAERKRLGMTLEEYRNRPVALPPMVHHRHKNRRCCAYCGVTMIPRSVLPRKRSSTRISPFAHGAAQSVAAYNERNNDVRTWDHVVPRSLGGAIQIPCCNWCNSKKGDTSLTDWLRSEGLALRTSIVSEREVDPDPMSRTVLAQLRDEDLTRLRRALDYHMS